MGPERRSNARYRHTPIVAALYLALGLCAAPAFAQAEAEPAAKKDKMMELLEKLKVKGIITEEEYDELAGNTPEARAEARAERRNRAQKEAVEVQKAEATKERFNGRWNNGISFETADRRNAFTLGGRIQVDYRAFDKLTSADTFDIRRAYLTLQGRWNEWLTWDLSGDLAQTTTVQSVTVPGAGPTTANTAANGGSILDVAWVNAAYSDAVQLRFGQFKMPFSLEEQQSSRFLDFQERSLMNALVPAKERGAMVHGVPAAGVTYGVALSTGQGKNNNDVASPAATLDVIGRATVNFAELLGGSQSSVYHAGIAGSHGQLPTGFGLSQRTEARGLFFFTTRSFTGEDVIRERLGAEGAIALGPVKLQGEMTRVSYTGTSAAGVDYDRSIDAGYVQVQWMLTGERFAETYRQGAFGRIVPITNYTPGGPMGGAWEAGLRYSSYDASDFTASNPAGTGVLAASAVPLASVPYASVPTNRADAITASLKWHWNPNLKLYLNYVETWFDTLVTVNPNYGGVPTFEEDRERAVTLRVAYDF